MDEQLETADEYGRRSRCLRDHRKSPFRFKHHLADIQATALGTAADGFVTQSGLGSCSFPEPSIIWDDPIEPSNGETCHSLDAGSWLSSLRDLLVPIQELDLGTLPDADVQQTFRHVTAKRDCRLDCAWLPLTSLNNERDEGLMLPSESVKMQYSLLRELELETISSSMQTWDNSHDTTADPTLSLLSRASHRIGVEDVTPPLSPISDTPSPFIPGSDAAIIDLTSEPASPCTPKSPQDQINGTFFPPGVEPSSSTPMAEPAASRFQHELEPTRPNPQDVVMEVPLIMTSSDAPCESDAAKNILPPQFVVDLAESPASTANTNDVDVDNVMSALFNDRELDPTCIAEQEQLNPADSMSRVPVPVLDFQLPRSDWIDRTWSAGEHFLWLRAASPKTYEISQVPTDGRLNRSLRWALFAGESAATLLAEEIEPSRKGVDFLTNDKTSPPIGSDRYMVFPQAPAILEMKEDAELQSSITEADDASKANGGALRRNEGLFQPCASNQAHPNVGRREGRNLDDVLLPDSSDPNATARLLSSFMELRAVKRRRLSPR
ncbi:hypothetical protein L249_4403 [Ophiocordyceps polyrhachis-furcata BCC 54312]|uniref:Uncharacterized protein n=1 Tax=Ophiocordyceps polyrhachis-furcata BCC 54312 TaxID=1330021 RepID=A0A367L852_9HYPO|nr:hypothetical protein L249_4403 [Ophiocordyceps polyrhachis-furcata BCC 54312]